MIHGRFVPLCLIDTRTYIVKHYYQYVIILTRKGKTLESDYIEEIDKRKEGKTSLVRDVRAYPRPVARQYRQESRGGSHTQTHRLWVFGWVKRGGAQRASFARATDPPRNPSIPPNESPKKR